MVDASTYAERELQDALNALRTENDRLTAALRWIEDQSVIPGFSARELGAMATDTLAAAPGAAG